MKDDFSMILKDCLYGLLVVIAVMGCEYGVTLYYGKPVGLSPEQYTQYVNMVFLLTALPAALMTFLLTGLLKTKSKEAALQRSVIWSIMVALLYVIISLGNNHFLMFFGNRGIYALLFCVFNGPIVYAIIKRLEGSLIY